MARDSLKVIMESIGLQMLSTDFQAGRTRGKIWNDVSRMSRQMCREIASMFFACCSVS